MTVEIHKLQKLRMRRESTFGVDASGTFGDPDWYDIPAMEGSITLTIEQDMLDPLPVQVYKDQHVEKVLGVKRATLTFKVAMSSPGATTNGAAHTRNWLGFLLRDIMGGENQGEGFTVDDATPAATGFDHSDTNSAAAAIYPGSAIGVTVGSGIEWRGVRTTGGTSTATLTPKLNFSASPVDTAVCYGCSTYYMAEDARQSFQAALYGVESNDRFLVMGGQCDGMTIEQTLGQLLVASFTLKFSDWKYGTAVADGGILTYGADTSMDGAITEASYGGLGYPVVQSGFYYQQTVGTATYSSSTSYMPATSEQWNPGIQYIPQTGPNAGQTIFQWIRNRKIPVIAGSFNIPHEDVTWINHKINRTDKAFMRVFGGQAGSTIILEAPTCQITNVQRVDDGDLAYQTINWEARHDSEAQAATGEDATTAQLRRSAFRIHLG